MALQTNRKFQALKMSWGLRLYLDKHEDVLGFSVLREYIVVHETQKMYQKERKRDTISSTYSKSTSLYTEESGLYSMRRENTMGSILINLYKWALLRI